MNTTANNTPLGLYVHLPFCPARCPYCDFAARPWEASLARPLLAAIHWHLEQLPALSQGRSLTTVYFGGGTPSMWPARDLVGLLEAVVRALGLESGAEVTLEANPGTVSAGKLLALRRAGFNRLSLGAQSFDAGILSTLGRRHGPDDTRRAADRARQAGFANLSLDLIYGLPGQTPDLARADLAAALELAPDHLSLYELTLGAGTPFAARYRPGQPPLPDEAALVAMESRALEMLERAGLARYEVSNFARPGRECRHNADTWAGADYLSLGPGAHGHLAGVRWAWAADPAEYVRAIEAGREPLAFRERLTPEQRALEVIMLGLRTVAGVDMALLGRLLGRPAEEEFVRALARVLDNGWARLEGSRLLPTARGLAMADAAAALFA